MIDEEYVEIGGIQNIEVDPMADTTKIDILSNMFKTMGIPIEILKGEFE